VLTENDTMASLTKSGAVILLVDNQQPYTVRPGSGSKAGTFIYWQPAVRDTTALPERAHPGLSTSKTTPAAKLSAFAAGNPGAAQHVQVVIDIWSLALAAFPTVTKVNKKGVKVVRMPWEEALKAVRPVDVRGVAPPKAGDLTPEALVGRWMRVTFEEDGEKYPGVIVDYDGSGKDRPWTVAFLDGQSDSFEFVEVSKSYKVLYKGKDLIRLFEWIEGASAM
jgi:hypothetical protein